MNILKINKLTKNFFLHNANREIHSCRNISFTLEEGKFLGIVGRSGAGKSTILKCIHRTYIPTDGEIIYNSKAFGEINLTTATEREILYLRKEHVMNALTETGHSAHEAKEKAEKMLDYFRLPENLWDIYPNTFSGGERLRLNLAHTMVKRPRLMLLDEPTASLDDQSKLLVRDMILSLKNENTSMIGIFHDLKFMDGICDNVFNISEGTFE